MGPDSACAGAGGAGRGHGFAHEALFYGGPEDFLAGTLPFIREGLAAGEPVLVAVAAERIRLLERALGRDARHVAFVDMTRLGRNPAAIISAWRDFLRQEIGRRGTVRGIGEPIWAGRSEDEVIEAQHHESLLNLAFGDGSDWRLLCPYDIASLEPEVVLAARRTHPVVVEGGRRVPSEAYIAPSGDVAPDGDLRPAPAGAEQVMFDVDGLAGVRQLVRRRARAAGYDSGRIADFVVAVSEITTNSIRHGGGSGTLAMWRAPDALVCEVRDVGRIADPLAGRSRPHPDQRDGRGLWLANELADLVQVRAGDDGNVIRLWLRDDGEGPAGSPPA
jgi:anti-sigma regulatory factor (Ser/Thr protein kinase)